MLRLKVENFSCINRADFVLGNLTVLIGPQASGKSVLSKLVYFFLELATTEQHSLALEQNSFDSFPTMVKNRFSEWFPIAAWGAEKFKIEFEMGEYKIRITRTSYDESIRNNLRVWTSNLVKSHHKHVVELAKAARTRVNKASNEHLISWEIFFDVRRTATKLLREQVGKDFVVAQTFIPAGRSFFTNLGRAFMALEQARTMDPVTLRFGRFYASFFEHLQYLFSRRGPVAISQDLSAMLGGTIIWEGELPLLKLDDGRVVPFSAMSSGQQELFPLVVALSSLSQSAVSRSDDYGAHLIYIEEPEAHLFPSAQSKLVQVLAALIADTKQKRKLLLTTHSPYVLSTINNLIKAGDLSGRLSGAKLAGVNSIIRPACQLPPGAVRAYAINDRELHSIIDETGLIAADYLDSISGEIGEDFSRLLDLEFLE